MLGKISLVAARREYVKEIAMKRALLILALAFSGAAFAQMRGHDMGGSGGMQGMPGIPGQGGMQMGSPGSALAEGEVRRVDADAGKVTLRHDAIPSMNMPSMTMVYHVNNPAFLDQVSAGDRVRFSMEKVDGVLTATNIEPLR